MKPKFSFSVKGKPSILPQWSGNKFGSELPGSQGKNITWSDVWFLFLERKEIVGSVSFIKAVLYTGVPIGDRE